MYELIALPPSLAGAVNETSTWPSPAVTAPIDGGPETLAATAKVRAIGDAAAKTPFPVCRADTVQVPTDSSVKALLPLTTQTNGVFELHEIGKPDEAEALNVGDVPKVCGPGFANTIACPPSGVTAAEGADGRLSPLLFVAETRNEYGVPFARPVTVSGLAVPVATAPPGLAVIV